MLAGLTSLISAAANLPYNGALLGYKTQQISNPILR